MSDLTASEIILQLISSIRNLDGRIDELKITVKNKFLKKKAIEETKKRIIRLLETRMFLVHSLMDKKLMFEKYLGEETKIGYNSFKRSR